MQLCTSMAQRSKAKRAKLDPAMLQDDSLILICDWAGCRQLFQDLELFFAHVAAHAGQVDVKTEEDSKVPTITCIWDDCGFETTDQKEVLFTHHLFQINLQQSDICHSFYRWSGTFTTMAITPRSSALEPIWLRSLPYKDASWILSKGTLCRSFLSHWCAIGQIARLNFSMSSNSTGTSTLMLSQQMTRKKENACGKAASSPVPTSLSCEITSKFIRKRGPLPARLVGVFSCRGPNYTTTVWDSCPWTVSYFSHHLLASYHLIKIPFFTRQPMNSVAQSATNYCQPNGCSGSTSATIDSFLPALIAQLTPKGTAGASLQPTCWLPTSRTATASRGRTRALSRTARTAPSRRMIWANIWMCTPTRFGTPAKHLVVHLQPRTRQRSSVTSARSTKATRIPCTSATSASNAFKIANRSRSTSTTSTRSRHRPPTAVSSIAPHLKTIEFSCIFYFFQLLFSGTSKGLTDYSGLKMPASLCSPSITETLGNGWNQSIQSFLFLPILCLSFHSSNFISSANKTQCWEIQNGLHL